MTIAEVKWFEEVERCDLRDFWEAEMERERGCWVEEQRVLVKHAARNREGGGFF